ncbi:FYVE zinc finger [Macleaya cordata]|uniref:FYVE zinc finger n=1 Tax=Macleaya cordata TaxID=56857 RepID=A0A200PVZ4_MACCD|nr:FYVE zinc finger [Macleaya cordata]
MADPVSYGNSDRDIEQALIALKKGTQLIKYSRKGKPKLRPFRLSPDETALIWYSRGEERNLKLSSVSRLIPGQRTAVFRRYLRPEKDYLSFSLLYNNGERSLDLICKDKVEAEVWFAGLKALISTGRRNRRTRSDISDFQEGGDFLQNGRLFGAALDVSSSLSRNLNARASVEFSSHESPLNLISSDVGSDRANMQLRPSNADGFRISVSSAAPSCSSQGSGPDDIESLGDVYVWGEVWCDGSLSDGSVNSFPSKIDVLLPRPLESNVVLDVHQISSGVGHAALVTRQGEVFTWGEQSGGRLGHGIGTIFSRPQLVEFLAVSNVDYVTCGEYHTCAISMAGDLFTWGDGAYNTGLLGNSTDVSHWKPKRVSGPLEGLQVLSVACGTWHSALTTSNGKLFTFGDGAFGVLGHGDRESSAYPREVECLSGVKTVKVACGVWHTAAIVEVMGQFGANVSSRKLFTWGDGDKNRLGHGDKETRLVPTCVPSLADYNFQHMACGHNITVALTTSGHVFTMGSTAHGQLGNPLSDGKLPCLVQDKLVGQFVEEVSCGTCHVSVLTSRNEVFTWGCGANGRLGHGDIEDRKAPTLVEALKDRHVKSISCGSNFTASICIHKWVSGADQSLCSGCRQTFGFTRKRHNCYHCGLVHCHACSSKKALRAALAPTPGKPHRVCDSCYVKLKASENGSVSTFNRKNVGPRRSIDNKERFVRGELRSSKPLLSRSTEPLKYLDIRSFKQGVSTSGVPQVSSLSQLKDIALPSSLTALQYALKPVVTSAPQATVTPRPASPYARKPSPPRSATPVFSKSIIDSLKKTNELLNQEVLKLQSQVKSLKQKCEYQDLELQKSQRRAEEESSKCIQAMEVIKATASQLKDMTKTLPADVYESETLRAMHAQVEALLQTNGSDTSRVSSSLPADSSEPDQHNMDKPLLANESSTNIKDIRMDHTVDDTGVSSLSQDAEGNKPSASDIRETVPHQSTENGSRTHRISSTKNGGEEVIEQFEPGVYITLFQLRNGTKIFKRVRFSKRKFDEQQAADWWKENSSKVFQKYKNHGTDSAPTGSSANATPAEEEEAVPPPES